MADPSYNYSNLAQSLQLLFDDIQKMHDIIEVAQRGLRVTQAVPTAVKVLAKVQGEEESEKHKKSLKDVQRIASIAKEEIDSGFPFLYSQSAILLYSYLEAAIKRFIITYFKNNDIEKIKEVANIKINFSEFINLDENEKYDYLFIQYEKLLTIGIQYGITRFENLLNPIAFSGKVNADVSKSIFELSQIRNNILHRAGVVDKQFISNCSWLKYSIGEKVKVTNESYELYYSAVCKYVTTIVIRLDEKNGKRMSEFKDED